MSSNLIIISRHVIFDETAFPFAERDGPSTPATFECLDESDAVLAPIGSPHKFLPAGTSSGASTPAVVAPRAPPGAPSTCKPDAILAPALRPYTTASSPAPRAAPSPSSPASCAATPSPASPSPAPRTAMASPSSTERYVPPALRAGRGTSSPGPRGPPLGFPPLERVVTQVFSRRPRPVPASTPAPAPAPAPAPLPKGAVAVPPVINQHSMATRVKRGFRVPALFTATHLSPVPKMYRGGLADPAWWSTMVEEYDALLKNHTWDLVPRPPRPMLSLGSGSSSTSSPPTALWNGTRRAGFFEDSHNAPISTSRRLSARLSNRRQFVLCSLWLSHGNGLFTSLM
jgi:hypothetical protein